MVDTNAFTNDPNGAGNSVDLKIAVLGKSLVGKSALTYRFISDKFPTEHDTTIEDQYKINTTIDEYNCKSARREHPGGCTSDTFKMSIVNSNNKSASVIGVLLLFM